MKVWVHNSGQRFTPLAEALDPMLVRVSGRMSGGEYGGPMRELWIGVELYEYGMNVPDRPPYEFRFQRRVSPRALGIGPRQVYFDVGHYSVRPTFDEMRAESTTTAAQQVLAVLSRSVESLRGRRQLRGFNFGRFESDFVSACRECAESKGSHSVLL